MYVKNYSEILDAFDEQRRGSDGDDRYYIVVKCCCSIFVNDYLSKCRTVFTAHDT